MPTSTVSSNTLSRPRPRPRAHPSPRSFLAVTQSQDGSGGAAQLKRTVVLGFRPDRAIVQRLRKMDVQVKRENGQWVAQWNHIRLNGIHR